MGRLRQGVIRGLSQERQLLDAPFRPLLASVPPAPGRCGWAFLSSDTAGKQWYAF